jgi:serine/threonine-protein kinase
MDTITLVERSYPTLSGRARRGTYSQPHTLVDEGRHQVIALLATGGMAKVYLAQDRQTGERVALKVMDPRLADNLDLVSRFFGEARVSHRVSHPRLGKVLESAWSNDGVPYLVLELLDGESLSALLGRGPIEPGAVAAFGAQIADALSALHAASIVHCDVKPENVLVLFEQGLAGWPQVAVIDFGVACFLDETGSLDAQRISGTPAYMAPEHWRGHVDERTDVYSLGCLLYELATGRVPFEGTVNDIMNAHLGSEPLPPSRHQPRIPAALEREVLRMLAKNPGHRPATIATVAQRLTDLALRLPAASPHQLRRAG